MGYRSQVRYVIYARPEILDAFIAKHSLLGNKFLSELKEDITYGLTGQKEYAPDGSYEVTKYKVLNFYNDSIKWYDDYPEIADAFKLMDDIDENWENKVDFEFVRVGEEYNDIERKYSVGAYGFIFPTTTIESVLNLEDLPNEND